MVKKPWKKHWDSKKNPIKDQCVVCPALEALKLFERSGVSGLQRIMDPLHGLLLESRGFWCEVVKKITLSLYVKPKILFRSEAPLFCKDFGSDSQTHDLKKSWWAENLPHMTSHQNILLNERAVLRFLHLSSAVMTYIHPWKLTWGTQ